VTDGLHFGEGPRWHDGRLWLSDIQAGRVLALVDDGRLEVVHETAGASGLGWLPDGRLVISCLGRPYLQRVDGDEITLLHDLRHLGWSLNDMVVGPDGRIYVDLYRHPDGDTAMGDILLITPDGDVQVAAPDIDLPNGLAITADGSTLIASETNRARLLAFTIGADGTLHDQRVFADLGENRHPDGLCLDAEGAVWVASYTTGECLRVREGGEITHRIETPGRACVAPALGGDDRHSLFVVVNESTDEVLGRSEPVGTIEMTRVDVPGAGWP
jgi:sugar lactone lactonase YvrE